MVLFPVGELILSVFAYSISPPKITQFQHEFCHDQFRDFVLTRIKDANLSDPSRPDGKVDEERERVQQDKQWNRIVDLELIPHPKIKHPEAVMLDYGMFDGCLKVEVRSAVAGYLLRLWNVDCSKEHILSSPEMQLALRNSEALYGVENAMLAPGVILHER